MERFTIMKDPKKNVLHEEFKKRNRNCDTSKRKIIYQSARHLKLSFTVDVKI